MAMWLKLDLDGIVAQIRIKGYTPSSHDEWDSQWCKVDFSFSSDDWLNYHKENDEVLLSCEVEELAAQIEKLLCDELEEVKELPCIEPDFTFRLNPKRDLRKDPRYTYIREGCEFADSYIEWTITFWHDGLTANYLSLTLDQDDMQLLLKYLYLVMGKIRSDSDEIDQMIKSGYIYG